MMILRNGTRRKSHPRLLPALFLPLLLLTTLQVSSSDWFIAAPAWMETGGPEALHQLCMTLKAEGARSSNATREARCTTCVCVTN